MQHTKQLVVIKDCCSQSAARSAHLQLLYGLCRLQSLLLASLHRCAVPFQRLVRFSKTGFSPFTG
jgi:hypothetical protein